MSEKNLIYKNKTYKKKLISISDIGTFSKMFSSKILQQIFLIYMANKNKSNPINIKAFSIKRILLNGHLKPNDFILFYFYKESFKKSGVRNIKQKEVINEEITDDEDENAVAIKKGNEEQKNQTNNNNKEKINLDIKNKNENIFNPEFPLLRNKITNTYSNIDNLPKKYINLIIFYNKITISIDYLKCFYLTLFFCGIFNLINYLAVLSNKNINFLGFYNLYYIFYFILAFILMATGFFGYKKINENVYNDKICLGLTQLSFISPIFSFVLSRISSEDNVNRNTILDIIINLLSSFISFLCIMILKEVKRVQNSEKNIIEI